MKRVSLGEYTLHSLFALILLYTGNINLSILFCKFSNKILHFVELHKKNPPRAKNPINLTKPEFTANKTARIADNTNEKEMIFMTREQERYIKSAAAGAVTGGLAFLAVRSLTSNRRLRRKTTAKAMKLLGNFMDSL